MRRHDTTLPAGLRLLLAVLALLGAPELVGAQTRLSRDPNEVVVALTQEIDGIRDPDPGPRVEVFGDGRFRVHFPVYMKRAGDYEGKLSSEEFDSLLAAAESPALAEVESKALRKRLRARAGGRRLQQRSAAVRSRIDLRLESADRARGLDTAAHMRRLAWRDLRATADRHPDEPSLSALATLERRLQDLRNREELRPIGSRR